MRKISKTISILLFLLSIINCSKSFAQETFNDNKPKTLEELKNSIQIVLKDTKTPGAGIVILSGDKTIMVQGFGKADIEKKHQCK